MCSPFFSDQKRAWKKGRVMLFGGFTLPSPKKDYLIILITELGHLSYSFIAFFMGKIALSRFFFICHKKGGKRELPDEKKKNQTILLNWKKNNVDLIKAI
jgi:hypothetical protein